MLVLLLSLQPLPQPPFLALTGVIIDSLSEGVKIPMEVDGDVIEFRVRSLDKMPSGRCHRCCFYPGIEVAAGSRKTAKNSERFGA